MDKRITCNFQGRLGNLLYEIAHTLSIGWRNNAQIVFCTEHEKGYYNDQPSYVNYVRHIIQDYPLIHDARGFRMEYEDVRKPPRLIELEEDTILYGFWTSSFYFKDYREKIIQLYTRKDKAVVDDLVNMYRRNINKPIVAVHVRRTDYVNEYGWGLGLDYYGRAYRHMRDRLGDCHYLIFSDDTKWCMENLYFMQSKEVVSNKDFIEMQLMGRFDGLMGANSTFSAWGAILGNAKEIVFPAIWRDTKGGHDPYNEFIYEENWNRL